MGTVIGGVELSRPEKELFPASSVPAVTKRDLAIYYARVAHVLVPHVRGRPISMERFPDGIDGPSFYEKRVPGHFPAFVPRVQVQTRDGSQEQVMIDDERTLIYLANQACVTPHTWLSTAADLQRPDQLMFDLDPTVPGLRRVRRATRLVGDLLTEVGLESYLKTTGSRGYHIVVPLRRGPSFDVTREFARAVAEVLVHRAPEVVTTQARKNKRGHRVLIDVQRNAYGQTAVPAYAVRARPGAPVAVPIRWADLHRIGPAEHTIRSVPRRLAQIEDPWARIGAAAQELGPALEKLRRLTA